MKVGELIDKLKWTGSLDDEVFIHDVAEHVIYSIDGVVKSDLPQWPGILLKIDPES